MESSIYHAWLRKWASLRGLKCIKVSFDIRPTEGNEYEEKKGWKNIQQTFNNVYNLPFPIHN